MKSIVRDVEGDAVSLCQLEGRCCCYYEAWEHGRRFTIHIIHSLSRSFVKIGPYMPALLAGDVAPRDSTASRFICRVDELWNGNICLLRDQAQGFFLASVNAHTLFVDKTGIEAQDMGATLLAQPSPFRLKFAVSF